MIWAQVLGALLGWSILFVLLRGWVVPQHVRRERMLEKALRGHNDVRVQIGSGHQRSVLAWTQSGWTRSAEALTETPRCLHRRTIDVESTLDPDVILARICEDCGEQLSVPSLVGQRPESLRFRARP